jgi:hypothetical protein
MDRSKLTSGIRGVESVLVTVRWVRILIVVIPMAKFTPLVAERVLACW